MDLLGERTRFWLPVVALGAFTAYATVKLVRAHVDPKVSAPNYVFTNSVQACRGSIYSAYGENYPYAKSVPFWEYHLDPLSLTNAVLKRKGGGVYTKTDIVNTIADALELDRKLVAAMADAPAKRGWRNQFLKLSSDQRVHDLLADSKRVRGIKIEDHQVRQYVNGRKLCHVLGSVNFEHAGSAGAEQRYNRELTGTPGLVQGMRDARGQELYDKRQVSIDPIPGDDVYLTIDHNIQFEAEDALKWGVKEYGAGTGWCIVMDSRTGAVLAMASLPDFDPVMYGQLSKEDPRKLNRAIGMVYEPGSVMKTITVAAAIEAGKVNANTRYRTNRDDNRYYKLPGDGSHVWEPTMTIKDAIVHSSNIVVGKLAWDFGPLNLFDAMKRFGFGSPTGVGLPGEEFGILPDPRKRMWDKASWSRAGIGQFVAVTAIQLCGAYQSIANDGLRMKPYIVDRIVAADGTIVKKNEPTVAARTISARTAKTMREIMLDVASPQGTARRAAIRGYSVAGKTGTAQKHLPGIKGYAPGLYRATFCGIVPASEPRLVVLVTLDFDAKTKFHQGGNSAGPVFKRIATAALRYLMIPPDRPDELVEFYDDDEFDKVMDTRARKYEE